MKLALYLSLIFVYLPLIVLVVKNRIFFKSPFYATYLYSIFFLNVVGSCIIFFPELNIYGMQRLFSFEFYGLLILQGVFFYIFFPANNKFKLRIYDEQVVSRYHLLQARKAFWYLLSFTVIILLLFYVRYGLPTLYNVDFSSGNGSLMASRIDFFNTAQQVWFYRIGFYVLPQLAGVIFYLIIRRNVYLISRVSFMIFVMLVSILALSFLHKTPVVLFWFSIFLAKILDDKKANASLILRWCLGILTLIVLWYVVYFPGRELGFYADFMMLSVLNRVFGVYPLGLAMSVEITKEYGFFYGTTMNNPLGVLPYETVQLSKLIHFKLAGIPGNHPAPALGYAYADFGWIGAILTLFFIKICLFSLQVMVNQIKNKFLYIALVSYLSLRVMFLSMSSASEILLNVGEVITLIIVLMTYFFAVSRYKKC